MTASTNTTATQFSAKTVVEKIVHLEDVTLLDHSVGEDLFFKKVHILYAKKQI